MPQTRDAFIAVFGLLAGLTLLFSDSILMGAIGLFLLAMSWNSMSKF